MTQKFEKYKLSKYVQNNKIYYVEDAINFYVENVSKVKIIIDLIKICITLYFYELWQNLLHFMKILTFIKKTSRVCLTKNTMCFKISTKIINSGFKMLIKYFRNVSPHNYKIYNFLLQFILNKLYFMIFGKIYFILRMIQRTDIYNLLLLKLRNL